MSNPKRHHFIPRWYLKNFADINSGFLHLYDKRKSEFRRQKPEQVMTVNNYYKQSWVAKGVDKNILEKTLSVIEHHAKKAFEKLIYNPKSLTDDDTSSMLIYLELQRIRVPRQAKVVNEQFKAMLTRFALNDKETASALANGKVEIEVKDSFRFEFMKKIIGNISPYFSRMVWDMVSAPYGYSFVTSDSPVSFFNIEKVPPLEPGIALVGTIVLFPLSSKHLLTLRHPEYVEDSELPPLTQLEKVEIQDGFIEINHGTEWTKEHVNKTNCVMLELSEDIIVANSREVLESAVKQS